MSGIDLSVELKGLIFRNPIIPGASDVVLDETGVVKCLENGVGGVITKSFSSTPLRTRARPWHFNYRSFGKGLESSWITRGGFHPLSCEQAAEKLVPRMARLCRDAGVPLIVSVAEGADIEDWVRSAKRFEQAGANMLEFNFSCPHGSGQLGAAVGSSIGHDIPLTMEIVRSVKKAVKIPISVKTGFSEMSFETHIHGLVEAGADCLTPSIAHAGMLIDVEKEVPFGGLGSGGYQMGRALLPLGLSKSVKTRQVTELPLIGVGGVHEAKDAIMYLLVGCSLVEIASAIYRNGFGTFKKIVKGMEEWMGRKGYSSPKDFIGKVHSLAAKVSNPALMPMEWPFPMPQEKSSPVIPLVDMETCTRCGRCQDFCLYSVYKVDSTKGVVVVDHEHKCWGCGDCVGWCPANAIKLVDRATAEVIWDNQGLAKPYRPENWRK